MNNGFVSMDNLQRLFVCLMFEVCVPLGAGWTEPASSETFQEKQFANTSTYANDLTVHPPVRSVALNQKLSMPVL